MNLAIGSPCQVNRPQQKCNTRRHAKVAYPRPSRSNRHQEVWRARVCSERSSANLVRGREGRDRLSFLARLGSRLLDVSGRRIVSRKVGRG